MSTTSQRLSVESLPAADQALFQRSMQALQAGNREEPERNLRSLVGRYPGLTMATFLLANIEIERQNLGEAVRLLEQAHAEEPREPRILVLLAQCHEATNQHEQALECFLKLHDIEPDSNAHLRNIGFSYSKIRQFDKARDYLRAALQKEPDNSVILNSLGLVMMSLGEVDQSIDYLQHALRVQPDRAGYHGNIAQAYLWKADHALALQHFQESTQNHFARRNPPAHGERLRASRIIHDFEQLQYLCALDNVDPVHGEYLERIAPIAERARLARDSGDTHIDCSNAQIDSLASFYGRLTHLGDGARVPGKALNPDLDIEAIETAYHSASPEILVLDNVLTEAALDKLYRYCLESRIFVHENEAGYLGALLSQGFASPLLLQICDEIRQTFPRIFADNRLTQSWAFKYDSTLTGIKTHADFASVNMNFWISPDRGNLDPDHGGLVVWDKESPPDWDINDYNGNEAKVAEFLNESEAREIVIPFRQNRAAIFNSNLFHRTDDISFADVYTDRRINVTFLYGAGLRV